jgi:hypothetical protein
LLASRPLTAGVRRTRRPTTRSSPEALQVIETEEARIARQIFKAFAGKLSMRDIAHRLSLPGAERVGYAPLTRPAEVSRRRAVADIAGQAAEIARRSANATVTRTGVGQC